MIERPHRGALIAAGTLLGAGLGGFIDGIVFHQILQLHSLLSSIVEPVDVVTTKYNVVWDGFYHAFTWLVTVSGIGLLWRAGLKSNVPWSTRTFVGSLVLGWGLFNLVEGVIDHHILGLHHVRPGTNEVAWDIAFLVAGALLVAAGSMLIRAGRADLYPRGVVRPSRPPKQAHEYAST